jgi:bifunctional DNase/RNase
METATSPDGGSGSWVEMQLKGVLLDPTHEVPVLILRSVAGHLMLPIWIGLPEANAIAMPRRHVPRTPSIACEGWRRA